jgi:hypothetical protein
MGDELRRAVDALASCIAHVEDGMHARFWSSEGPAPADMLDKMVDQNGRYVMLDARAAYVMGLAALELGKAAQAPRV